MKLLITGGAGYIGSHTIVELVEKGHEVVVVDNLCNSSRVSIDRVQEITGTEIPLHEFDLSDKQALSRLFEAENFDGVIHFAGLKAVGESVEEPLLYYRSNLVSTINLCEVMQDFDVYSLVFSSSATVYGEPQELPLTESSPTPARASNPYGQTKLMIEHILQDLASSNPKWRISILRYFNPIGAHHSGKIGENPLGIPNNLMPYVSKVAVGELDELTINGSDYDTVDGTGVRDYIHVVDLAKGHVAALEKMPDSGVEIYNLGTGKGVSVLEAVHAFEEASGQQIKYRIGPRRDGDVATCYADSSKAEKELGWKADRTILQMCEDTWRWQSENPKGYPEN